MSTYQDRISKGLCGMCKAPEPGGPLCTSCKEKCKARAAAKRERNRAKGCLDCGAAVESGTRCDRCKEKQKASKKKCDVRRKAEGICTACPNKAKEGCTLCQSCIDKLSAVSSRRYHERKKAGVCRFCGGQLAKGNASLCEEHIKKARRYRKKLKLATFKAYGGVKCSACPEDCWKILEIDHIEGGGAP